jgi:putative transposase
MDTQKVTAEYRLSQWAQVIQARLDSGQSIKDFCLTAGISRNAYFYWQKRLRNTTCAELEKSEEPKTLVPNGWVQLAPQPQQMKATLDIEINGCRITANADTDPELLKKVCRALKSL